MPEQAWKVLALRRDDAEELKAIRAPTDALLMNTLWLSPALAFYALASAAFLADLTLKKTRLSDYAVAFLGIAVTFHALDLVARGLQAGNIPVANFAQSLSFFAWLTALVSLVMIVRVRIAVIGAVVAPSVLLAVGAAFTMMRPEASRMPSRLDSIWLP